MFSFLIIATIPLWTAFIFQQVYKTPVNQSQQSKKWYLFLCCAVLFLVIGLRHYDMGSVDSWNYYENWIDMREMSWSQAVDKASKSDIEAGYLYTIFVISRIFYYPQFVFVLSGLLFATAVGCFVYKNSEDVVLSMLIFVCLGLYNFMVQGLRQSIAISICLFSVEFVKKRKPVPFFLLLLLGYCFHHSCMVFALTYFLYGSEFNDNAKLKYIGILVALLVAAPFLQDAANTIMEREYEGEASSGSAWVATFTHVLILGAAFIFLPGRIEDKDTSFFVGFSMVGAGFYLIRYFQTQAFERISFYFLAGQMILLPTVLRVFTPQSRKLLTLLAACLSVALFLYRVNASYASQYFFFWQK